MEHAIKHRGDAFCHEIAGAGGWGDPLERDAAMGLRYVRNELVSLASARADYGVVFAGNPLAVDEAATRPCAISCAGRATGRRPLTSVGSRPTSLPPPSVTTRERAGP